VRFLQSPKAIGAELQQKTRDTDAKVREIKESRVSRIAAFDNQISKIQHQLEGVLNGNTPDNLADDLRSLRAWLRGGESSGSDLQPLASTA
jgi:hypothetical protein